jgi:hypothetical protein
MINRLIQAGPCAAGNTPGLREAASFPSLRALFRRKAVQAQSATKVTWRIAAICDRSNYDFRNPPKVLEITSKEPFSGYEYRHNNIDKSPMGASP